MSTASLFVRLLRPTLLTTCALASALTTACNDASTAPPAPLAPAARPSAAIDDGDDGSTGGANPDSTRVRVTLAYQPLTPQNATAQPFASATPIEGPVRVQFKNSAGWTRTVTDNGAGDLDATKEIVAVKAPAAASVSATVVQTKPQYMLAGASATAAFQRPKVELSILTRRKSTFRGRFVELNAARTDWRIINSGGGVVSVTGPNGFTATLTHKASQFDAIGQLMVDGSYTQRILLGEPGWYTFCETTAPVGFQIMSPKCFSSNYLASTDFGDHFRHVTSW